MTRKDRLEHSRDNPIDPVTSSMTLHARIHRALAETRREIDAPDGPEHWRVGWAQGYTDACDAIRRVLRDGS